jgi:hypothetical protein
MENEKLLNNILLIVLLLLVANYISNGSVLEVLKRYYEKLVSYFFNSIEGLKNTEFRGDLIEGIKQCVNTTPEIIHDNDFKQIYEKNNNNMKNNNIVKEDPNMKKLYHFLQSLVTVNTQHYELISSKNKLISMSHNDKESLNKFITKSFNCGDFRFSNLVILDSIVFLENSAGKELRPFRVSGDVYINKEPICKITLHLEMFIRSDSTFYGPFNSGFPTLTRIKLIRKDKIATPISEIPYITDYEELIATDNSLIPDSINFSTDSGTGYSE